MYLIVPANNPGLVIVSDVELDGPEVLACQKIDVGPQIKSVLLSESGLGEFDHLVNQLASLLGNRPLPSRTSLN